MKKRNHAANTHSEAILFELRKTLSKMELALGVIHDAIVWTDEGGNIAWCNKRFDELLNRPHIEILGLKFAEALPLKQNGTPLHPHLHPVGMVLKSGVSLNALYEFERHERGSQRRECKFLDVFLAPMKNERGQIAGISAIVSDATDEKRMEQKFQKLQDELIEAAKLATVGELAAGVAHEINNPLQAILGNLEIAELTLKEWKKEGKDELTEIIQEAKHAGERCKEIVKGLLYYARPSLSGTNKEVSLEQVLNETLLFTHTLFDKENVTVEKVWPTPLPTVRGNDRELMQVFVNLITNAVRAMLGTEVNKLKIGVKKRGEKVCISFEDSGEGIPRENIPRLFEPFFTTSYKTAQGAMKGTGLGLSICQKIIETHRGEIHVQSELGRGSIFTVILHS